jgi:GNAT superfamily N-acetyltransferase
MTIMSDPLPDTDLEQIQQRARRALDAAPASWIPDMETRAPIGGCSFIRFGDDPAIDQEMYLDVRIGAGQMTSPDARLDAIVEFVAYAPKDVMRLIAEIRRRARIVAASSYYLSPATGLAEVAYMVDPDWQGAGLAGLLHARMFEYARERGVRGFRADVLVGNTRMMRAFQRAGHQLRVKTSAGIEEVTMPFPEYTAGQLPAARGVQAAS